MVSCEYIIIGAGFAGAATAYHLARQGHGDILLLEQENIPGFHSSGRNAAMIRQCVPDTELAVLARDGAAFLRNLPVDWTEPVQFKQNGSLLLGSGTGWMKLKRDAEQSQSMGMDVALWTPDQAKRRVAVLEQAKFDGAVWCATDGIVDIHALLSGYLKAAVLKGAKIRYSARVRAIRVTESRAVEVATEHETFVTGVVVNAAGAWANEIARMVGAAPLPLYPCRRHLFVTPPLDWVDSTWPFVWDVTHDFYFRPEGQGLLLCACDQTEVPPGDPPLDPTVQEILAEKVEVFLPALSRVAIHKSWAGLRTLSADGRFAIGWDREVESFFWVAGLGGHGVTTSAAVGALAAKLLLAGPKSKDDAFSPARFSARSGAKDVKRQAMDQAP